MDPGTGGHMERELLPAPPKDPVVQSRGSAAVVSKGKLQADGRERSRWRTCMCTGVKLSSQK